MRQWNLIRLRKDSGLSQEEFSKSVNITISSYRNKESGQVDFTISEMFRIAKFFEKKIEDIFLDPNSIDSGIFDKKSVFS